MGDHLIYEGGDEEGVTVFYPKADAAIFEDFVGEGEVVVYVVVVGL